MRRLTILLAAAVLAATGAATSFAAGQAQGGHQGHAAHGEHQDNAAHARFARLPAAPTPDIAARVGEYGPPGGQLVVYEQDGALMADGLGLKAAPLKPAARDRYDAAGGTLAFERKGGAITAVTLDGTRLARRDLGAEVQALIRAGVKSDPDRLRAAALAATPPQEPAPKKAADLVDLATIDPTLKFDIRYAGTNNFMGIRLYEKAAAYLQRPAAEALGRAHRRLAHHGYGLLIHDGYRPWFVTWMFWEATPPEYHNFVADPSKGSRHNRGGAVDLTLYDLATGKVVEMPGRYDELSPRSRADFIGGTTRQRWLRDLLRHEMEEQGFEVYADEWWHFEHEGWRDYGIGTATFTELGARR